MSSEKTSSSDDDQQPSSRISAPLGTEEYERQFNRQASNAVHAIAKMPLVRVVCGLLSVVYCVMIVSSSFLFVKSQFVEGFQAWELLAQVGVVVGLWWILTLQGRIALYGEFDIQLSLFTLRRTQV